MTSSSTLLFAHRVSIWISSLSLHDALPISWSCGPSPAERTSSSTRSPGTSRPSPTEKLELCGGEDEAFAVFVDVNVLGEDERARSAEHTSELQSRENLVCRLLLEKKNIPSP